MSTPLCEQCSRALDRAIIYHCIWCGGFTIEPASDRCQCGGEFYPIAFIALHDRPFWPDDTRESRLSSHRPSNALVAQPEQGSEVGPERSEAGEHAAVQIPPRSDPTPPDGRDAIPSAPSGGTSAPKCRCSNCVDLYGGPCMVKRSSTPPDPEPAEPVSEEDLHRLLATTPDTHLACRVVSDLRAARERESWPDIHSEELAELYREHDRLRDQIATLTKNLAEAEDAYKMEADVASALTRDLQTKSVLLEAAHVAMKLLTRERDDNLNEARATNALYEQACRERDEEVRSNDYLRKQVAKLFAERDEARAEVERSPENKS